LIEDRIPESALANVEAIVAEANIVLEPIDNFRYSIPSSGRDDPVDAIRRRCKRRLREAGRTARKGLLYSALSLN
jgi:hypothetical protein